MVPAHERTKVNDGKVPELAFRMGGAEQNSERIQVLGLSAHRPLP